MMFQNRQEAGKKLVFASPVCALDTAESLKPKVNEVVCLAAPLEFMAVGSWYTDFKQVSDAEVVGLLERTKLLYEQR